MAYIYVLAAITAVLSVVVVALENKGILAIKYVLKTVASLCFVMIALLSMAKGGYDNWKILVIAGLVFGMLGDIFLSSNNVVADKKRLAYSRLRADCFLRSATSFTSCGFCALWKGSTITRFLRCSECRRCSWC